MNTLVARLEPFKGRLVFQQTFRIEDRKRTYHAGRRSVGAVDRAQAAEQTGQGVIGADFGSDSAVDLVASFQHAHQQRDLARKMVQQSGDRNTDDGCHFGH